MRLVARARPPSSRLSGLSSRPGRPAPVAAKKLMKGTAARMGVMKRVSLVFKAKANKALDKMEDPRETLDYSYQRQLELLTKVRRGVADVATSRKRVEDKTAQMQARAGAIDELMASGALDDAVGGRRDDIQSELDMMAAGSDVERELSRLKGEITTGAPKQLEGGANGTSQATQGQSAPYAPPPPQQPQPTQQAQPA